MEKTYNCDNELLVDTEDPNFEVTDNPALEFEGDPGPVIKLVDDPMLERELEDDLLLVPADKLWDEFWERVEVVTLEGPVIGEELAC